MKDDNLRVIKLYFGAKGFAKKSCLPRQVVDEFAAYCVTRQMEGHKIFNYKSAYIDFLRGEYGDTRTPGRRAKNEAKLSTVEYHDDIAALYGHVSSSVEDVEKNIHLEESMMHCMKGLTEQERSVLMMNTLMDMSQIEIARFLNLTDSRICQVLKNAEDKLKKRNAL